MTFSKLVFLSKALNLLEKAGIKSRTGVLYNKVGMQKKEKKGKTCFCIKPSVAPFFPTFCFFPPKTGGKKKKRFWAWAAFFFLFSLIDYVNDIARRSTHWICRFFQLFPGAADTSTDTRTWTV